MCILTEFGHAINLVELLRDAYIGLQYNIERTKEDIEAFSGNEDMEATVRVRKAWLEEFEIDLEIVEKLAQFYSDESNFDPMFAFKGGKPIIIHREVTRYHE